MSNENEKFISDSIKFSINKFAKERFANLKIFAIRVSKLHTSTIVSIEPVYYNDYLKVYGNPVNVYIYDSSLFLLYCGIETIKGFSNKQNEVSNQFNDFCIKHGIRKKENKLHDNPLIFLKVNGTSLVPYSKGSERDFYNSYFELEEVKPIYKFDKKK